MELSGIKACHRFGKPNRRNYTKKTFLRFVNNNNCKFALLNKEKLGDIDNFKYQFSNSTNIKFKRSMQLSKKVVFIYNTSSRFTKVCRYWIFSPEHTSSYQI